VAAVRYDAAEGAGQNSEEHSTCSKHYLEPLEGSQGEGAVQRSVERLRLLYDWDHP
jgi:hypothetical protein